MLSEFSKPRLGDRPQQRCIGIIWETRFKPRLRPSPAITFTVKSFSLPFQITVAGSQK